MRAAWTWLAAGTVWLDAVHKWVHPGRAAPSRCAKCSGKKCFTHFGCVTCWFHTFQLCYLLTRNFSVVSLDCSNWITVEPELAQTGMRKSLPLLAVLKHQVCDRASDEALVWKCETVVPFVCTVWKVSPMCSRCSEQPKLLCAWCSQSCFVFLLFEKRGIWLLVPVCLVVPVDSLVWGGFCLEHPECVAWRACDSLLGSPESLCLNLFLEHGNSFWGWGGGR